MERPGWHRPPLRFGERDRSDGWTYRHVSHKQGISGIITDLVSSLFSKDKYGNSRKKSNLVVILVVIGVILAIIFTCGLFIIILAVRNSRRKSHNQDVVVPVNGSHEKYCKPFENEIKSLFLPIEVKRIMVGDVSARSYDVITVAANKNVDAMVKDYIRLAIQLAHAKNTGFDSTKFALIIDRHEAELSKEILPSEAVLGWNYYTVMTNSYGQKEIAHDARITKNLDIIGYAARSTGANYCEIINKWEGLLFQYAADKEYMDKLVDKVVQPESNDEIRVETATSGTGTSIDLYTYIDPENPKLQEEHYRWKRLNSYKNISRQCVGHYDSAIAYERVDSLDLTGVTGTELDSVKAQIMNCKYILNINGFSLGDLNITDMFCLSRASSERVTVRVPGKTTEVLTYGRHILINPRAKFDHYIYGGDVDLSISAPLRELLGDITAVETLEIIASLIPQ